MRFYCIVKQKACSLLLLVMLYSTIVRADCAVTIQINLDLKNFLLYRAYIFDPEAFLLLPKCLRHSPNGSA